MGDVLREQFVTLMTRCGKLNIMLSSQCELQRNELEILHVISGEESRCQTEGINLNIESLQDRLQVSKPAISYTLNTLEKKEYIVREIDPNDRRRISVHITQEGVSASELSMRQHMDMWDQLLDEFGAENMLRLTSLLTRFFSVMDRLGDG